MLSKQDFKKIIEKILGNEILAPIKRRLLSSAITDENYNNLPEQIPLSLIVEKLNLTDLSKITDEDGYFHQITETENSDKSMIFYVLNEKQISCLHRLQVKETWEWLGGSPISLFTFSESEVMKITLGPNKRLHVIDEGTLFGAKNELSSSNKPLYSLVTCTCEPSFKIEHYANPTPPELKILKDKYPEYQTDIEQLTPKILNKSLQKTPTNNHNIMQTLFKIFTCCIGVKKNDEQEPLINNPSQGNR